MDYNRYLLDTHTIIWFQPNSPQIPKETMNVIKNPDNIILFSQVSLFEIAIKQRLGKSLGLSISIKEFTDRAIADGFTFLPIHNDHIYNYQQIPLNENHRDPFDRLLIATANFEKATIITADEKFTQYADLVKVLW
jgi:PIN domain nuclease of toxin-antitoxin system